MIFLLYVYWDCLKNFNTDKSCFKPKIIFEEKYPADFIYVKLCALSNEIIKNDTQLLVIGTYYAFNNFKKYCTSFNRCKLF